MAVSLSTVNVFAHIGDEKTKKTRKRQADISLNAVAFTIRSLYPDLFEARTG